jgi:hypothetical protein
MSVFLAVIFFCHEGDDCKFWRSKEAFPSYQQCVVSIKQASEEMKADPRVKAHAGTCMEVVWPKVV